MFNYFHFEDIGDDYSLGHLFQKTITLHKILQDS